MKRATPLSPEARRQAILDAVRPLVLEHGRSLSTRRIAQACGIAEGTIFRVFASKDDLLDEAVRAALSPHTLAEQLASLGPGADLTALVTAIVGVLQDHARTRHRLLAALPRPDATDPHHGLDPAARRRTGEQTMTAIARALEPRRAELAVSIETASGVVLALAFGSLFSATPAAPDAVAAVLLHGIAGPDAAESPDPHSATPSRPRPSPSAVPDEGLAGPHPALRKH